MLFWCWDSSAEIKDEGASASTSVTSTGNIQNEAASEIMSLGYHPANLAYKRFYNIRFLYTVWRISIYYMSACLQYMYIHIIYML